MRAAAAQRGGGRNRRVAGGNGLWGIRAAVRRAGRPLAPAIGRLCKETDERRKTGAGGIRTLDALASIPHFQCGPFSHSDTAPTECERDQAALATNRIMRPTFDQVK